jgi:hypothetical protein
MPDLGDTREDERRDRSLRGAGDEVGNDHDVVTRQPVAQMPPMRRKKTCGTKPATTRPRSDAEPVRSRTANASAMGAKALPKSDTIRPRKSSRVPLAERLESFAEHEGLT